MDSVDVTIAQQTIAATDLQIELSPPSGQYDGKVQQPEVTVRDTANNVIPESEYKVTYVSDGGANWKDQGTYTVKVENITGGNYDEATATYPLNALKKPVMAIVTAKDKVYDGNTKATIHVTWNGLVGNDRIDTKDLVGTFDNENVGTNKTVTITTTTGNPISSDKYDITIPSTTTASIFKAPATAPTLTANNRVYDGTAQPLVTVGNTGTTFYSASRDGVYSATVPTGTNAGTYTVWYKAQGDTNHSDSEPQSCTVTISPKTLTADASNIELSGSDLKTDTSGTDKVYYYEYDGTEKTPSVVIEDGNAVIPASEYTVSYGNNKNVTTADKKATVTITDIEGGNYTVSGSTTFEIRAGSAELTSSPQARSLTYTGAAQELVTVGTATGGHVEYKDPTTGTFGTNIPKATDADTYTVDYKVVGDGNHTDGPSGSVTVTIQPKTVVSPQITVDGTYDYTYSGSAKTPTVTVKDGNTEIPGPIADKPEYSVSYQNNVNAGRATVVVTDNNGGNYTVNGTATFEIGKAAASVGTDPTGKTGLKYNGTAQELITAGSATGGTMVYSLSKTGDYSAAIPTGKAVGEYEIWYKVQGDANHSDSTATALSTKAKIDKNTVDKPTIQVTPASVKYTGEKQDPTITVKDDAGLLIDGSEYTVTYKDANLAYSLDGSSYTFSIPTATDVGTYPVWYKVVSSGENYKDSAPEKVTRDAVISANQDAPKVRCDPGSFTYDGTAKTPTVVVLDSTGQHIIPESEYTVEFPANAINKGSYTVTVKDNTGGNYQFREVTGTFEIMASSQAPLSITDKPAYVYYGDTFYLSATGGSGGGAVKWNIAESGIAAINDSGEVTVSGTGSFTVKAYREAWGGYSQSNTDSVTFVAQPKPVTPVVTANDKSYNRNTDAALTVSTPIADATIPNAALETLSNAGGTVKVATEQVDDSVVLTLTAGGEKVEDIPVTLSVPVENAGPGTVAVLVNEDGTRETIRKSVVEDGAVNIPLNGSATVEIVDNSKEFADVSNTDWEADAVAFASAHELFSGTSETTFSPDQSMSRGMLATVLYNLEGRPEQDLTMGDLADGYSDVSSDAWYASGVAWAVENGIASGYGDGQFGPDDSITREQFVVMLWKYAGSPKASGQSLDFTDADQASGYAQEALCWAVEKGVLSGHGDGSLAPGGTATRAQAAQMLKNFMERA